MFLHPSPTAGYMFLPPNSTAGDMAPSPSRLPRPSRRESLKLPWPRSMRSKRHDQTETSISNQREPSARNVVPEERPDPRFCAVTLTEALQQSEASTSTSGPNVPSGISARAWPCEDQSTNQIRTPCAKQQKNAGEGYGSALHAREHSLHVSLTPQQVKMIAAEVYDQTIHETTLSLLTWWICEKPEHYEIAKAHIRELALDQVGFQLAQVQ